MVSTNTPKTTLIVLGPSGSGKTTFCNSLFNPQEANFEQKCEVQVHEGMSSAFNTD